MTKLKLIGAKKHHFFILKTRETISGFTNWHPRSRTKNLKGNSTVLETLE